MTQFDIRKYNNVPDWQSPHEIIAWIESLDDSEETYYKSIQIFNFAVNDLIAYGIQAVEPLIHLLLNTSNMRWSFWAAAWALRELGDKRAIEPLWQVYEKTENHLGIRMEIINSLGRLKDKKVFEVVVPLLNDNFPHVRYTAIRAMGDLGDGRAIPLLQMILEGGEKLFREIAQLMQKPSYNIPETERMLEISKVKFSERRLIIEALGKIGGLQSIGILSGIIHADEIPIQELSRYDRLRFDAVQALAKIDHSQVKEVLQSALMHRKYGVRRAARRRLALT